MKCLDIARQWKDSNGNIEDLFKTLSQENVDINSLDKNSIKEFTSIVLSNFSDNNLKRLILSYIGYYGGLNTKEEIKKTEEEKSAESTQKTEEIEGYVKQTYKVDEEFLESLGEFKGKANDGWSGDQ